jgi:HEAT repeat protein
MRWRAAGALGSAFGHIPDEHIDQAWKDLHDLTQDQDNLVREGAAEALGSAFGHIPDKHKDQAWEDLIKLTQDQDSDVRWKAAEALGSAFGHIPDDTYRSGLEGSNYTDAGPSQRGAHV